MEQWHSDALYRKSSFKLRIGITACSRAYWSGQLDEMSSTIVASFAKISVCRSDSLAFLASSSKDATKYSTSKHSQYTTIPVKAISEYLVAPEQLIPVPVLDLVPSMQELGDTVEPDVVCELLCVLPGERSTEG